MPFSSMILETLMFLRQKVSTTAYLPVEETYHLLPGSAFIAKFTTWSIFVVVIWIVFTPLGGSSTVLDDSTKSFMIKKVNSFQKT